MGDGDFEALRDSFGNGAGPPGRSSILSVSRINSVLCGAFV
jgi:hypothetical protein